MGRQEARDASEPRTPDVDCNPPTCSDGVAHGACARGATGAPRWFCVAPWRNGAQRSASQQAEAACAWQGRSGMPLWLHPLAVRVCLRPCYQALCTVQHTCVRCLAALRRLARSAHSARRRWTQTGCAGSALIALRSWGPAGGPTAHQPRGPLPGRRSPLCRSPPSAQPCRVQGTAGAAAGCGRAPVALAACLAPAACDAASASTGCCAGVLTVTAPTRRAGGRRGGRRRAGPAA